MSKTKNKPQVPVWEKYTLDYHEASEYFNIGINRLREITKDPGCNCTVHAGESRRELIIRAKFEDYINNHTYL